jgi:hypothetical protein
LVIVTGPVFHERLPG